MKIKGLTILLLITLWACRTEDPQPAGKYDTGILVVNEGNFGSGNGSLSYIAADGSVTQNVFSLENNNLGLGDVVQSITETDELFLVVVNNSNLLYALDKKDMTIAYTIENLSLPRYATSDGTSGYVTEWVSFTEAGRVTRFDLADGTITDTLTTGYGAEYPMMSNGILYVTNTFESTVSVIDPSTMTVTITLPTASSPGQIVTMSNGSHWIICAGGYDQNYNPANDGAVQQIENGDIITTIDLSQNVSTRAATNNNRLYVFGSQTVWEVQPANRQVNEYLTDADVTGYYGIGFDADDQLHMTDNKGFQGAGEVIRYTAGGIRDASFTVGVGPNMLLFR